MKLRLLSLFLLFISAAGYSQTGWIVRQLNINREMSDIYFINSNTGWAVGDTSGVFKTTDGGLNWVSQDIGYTGINLTSVRFINENTGFISGHDHSVFILESAYFFRTTNGGANWSMTYGEGGYTYFMSLFPVNDTLIYASLGGLSGFDQIGAIYVTTNGGSNFTSLWVLGVSHTLFFLNANTGWVSSYSGSIYGNNAGAILKTTNTGVNWVQQYSDIAANSTEFYKIQFLDANTGYALGKRGTTTRFLTTTDGGSNWNSTIYAHEKYRSMFFINPNTGWIGGSWYPDSSCIAYTTDAGQTWSPQKKYLQDHVNSIFFINSLTGWAALMSNNIMRTNTAGIVNIPLNGIETPAVYILEQNYPNPFNPATKIFFGLSNYGLVRIVVYDLSGKEIGEVINKNLSPGTYIEEFRGENLHSGVYFCVMNVNGHIVKTMKMMLVK